MNKISLLKRLYFYKLFGYEYIDECLFLGENEANFSNLDELFSQLKLCNLCELCKTRKEPILPYFKGGAKIMAVFKSPYFYESNEFYAGNFGEKILQNFSEAGIDLNDIYSTFLIKCKVPQNGRLSNEIILNCVPYLFDEIKILSPKIVILFGESVAKIALKNENLPDISLIHGTIFLDGGVKFMPTFDIKYISENQAKWSFLRQICRKF